MESTLLEVFRVGGPRGWPTLAEAILLWGIMEVLNLIIPCAFVKKETWCVSVSVSLCGRLAAYMSIEWYLAWFAWQVVGEWWMKCKQETIKREPQTRRRDPHCHEAKLSKLTQNPSNTQKLYPGLMFAKVCFFIWVCWVKPLLKMDSKSKFIMFSFFII